MCIRDSIYPGWYEGRTIHIHDKVRVFNGSETILEWTSQLYFNNSMNQHVSKVAPYSNHGPPKITNEEDIVYSQGSVDRLIDRNSGERLMVNLTKDGVGSVSYTHLRAHETPEHLVCRLLLEKNNS